MSRVAWSFALASLALVAAAACGEAPPPLTMPPPIEGQPPPLPPRPPMEPVKTAVKLEEVGLDASSMDRSVDPCKDFYQFACGGWLAKTEIPADRPTWSRSFSTIADRNEHDLKDILEGDAKDEPTQRAQAYYKACMNEPAIDAAKAKPIAPLLKLVKKVRDKASFVEVVAALHKKRIWPLFDVSDEQDYKDATKVVLGIDQNGLGLPNRDYYTKDDDKSKELRAKYVEHVERMLALAGFGAAAAKKGAASVLELETELAKVSKTPTERRDPKKRYNPVDRAGLEKLLGRFDWNAYFKLVGFPSIQEITVSAPDFLRGVDALLDKVKPAEWQTYLAWHVVRAAAPMLSKDFADESFRMEQAITGQKEQRPRWKRCVAATDGAVGELLAQAYVKKRFGPDAREAMRHYVKQVSLAFADEVQKLEWMDDTTKQHAIEKLKGMEYLIGYPEKWKTYDFAIGANAFENLLAAREHELVRELKKVGGRVDRGEWWMTPPTVNAYYSQNKNHMVFPAGILQKPFFDVKANVPVNLGAIGMVVGHELSHGFDDQGSKFDDRGNLSDWWSPATGPRFEAKTSCVEAQYAEYEALPGLKLNGKLTLGENIADNAGLKLAFLAYRAMRKGAAEVLVADGLSEDQQFFVATGQAWCTKQTDDFARMRVSVDPHSPARFRVNGSVSNLKEFADAFQCGAGAPMRRANACTVW